MKGNGGGSLLTVTIATAISAIAALTVIRFTSFAMNANTVLTHRGALLELRRSIVAELACPRVTGALLDACEAEPNANFIPLQKRGWIETLIRSPLDPPGGYTSWSGVGSNRYYLRARCFPCPACANGRKLVVEYMEGYPPRDPTVSLEPESAGGIQGHWQDLFSEVPLPCPL